MAQIAINISEDRYYFANQILIGVSDQYRQFSRFKDYVPYQCNGGSGLGLTIGMRLRHGFQSQPHSLGVLSFVLTGGCKKLLCLQTCQMWRCWPTTLIKAKCAMFSYESASMLNDYYEHVKFNRTDNNDLYVKHVHTSQPLLSRVRLFLRQLLR